jgi:hypothetical protein
MTRSINLVFIILLLSSFSLQAQTKKFEFGINGGPSIKRAIIKGSLDQNAGSFGFTAGARAEYHLSLRSSLVTNPSFQRKGFNFTIQFTDQYGQNTADSKVRYDFNYIVLPVLVRFYTKSQHFFLNSGPYLGFLTSQYVKYLGVGMQAGTVIENSDFFRPIEFGLTAGIGAKIPITEHFHFTAELQSSIGISNVLKNDVLAGWFDDKNYMRMFTGNIVLGMSYRL